MHSYSSRVVSTKQSHRCKETCGRRQTEAAALPGCRFTDRGPCWLRCFSLLGTQENTNYKRIREQLATEIYRRRKASFAVSSPTGSHLWTPFPLQSEHSPVKVLGDISMGCPQNDRHVRIAMVQLCFCGSRLFMMSCCWLEAEALRCNEITSSVCWKLKAICAHCW